MEQHNNGFLEMDDAGLWERFRNGDELAYTQIIRKYSKSLFNYGYRIHQDRDFLKDCVQDVFLELWNRRERISQTPSVKWYLFKSVRLRIFREQSKWNKHEELNHEYEFLVEFNIESKLIHDHDTQEQALKIKQILNALPTRQREIMYLRFYENLEFDHISEIMSISKQSVHNLLQKAYKNFRSEWLVLVPLFFRVL